MFEVIRTIINLINQCFNLFKQLLKSNKKAQTAKNVTITIHTGDNSTVYVYSKK